MPELPDLTVVAEGFHAALAGRDLAAAEAPRPLTLRATAAELASAVGRSLSGVRRRGKFLVFDLHGATIAINPMLHGRFALALPGDRRSERSALVLRFGPRSQAAVRVATWTIDASWLPPDAGSVEVRYLDSSGMGKAYVTTEGASRPVPGFGDPAQGPDIDDPALTLDVWRERIRLHTGELKALLRNQAFVAGIGNAYSDEILHAARLAPFRRRSSLALEEVDELYGAARATIDRACVTLRREVPPTFERQVRSFLSVHLRGGQPCPRCGTRITEVAARGERTSYCRGCQR